jgi:hypothetical protein
LEEGLLDPRPAHKELSGKIRAAKSAVSQGKIILVEPVSIISDAADLDYEVKDLPIILAELLEVTTPELYAGGRPPQKSYEKMISGKDLIAFKIVSERFKAIIYLKYSICDETFYLVSLHEDR